MGEHAPTRPMRRRDRPVRRDLVRRVRQHPRPHRLGPRPRRRQGPGDLHHRHHQRRPDHRGPGTPTAGRYGDIAITAIIPSPGLCRVGAGSVYGTRRPSRDRPRDALHVPFGVGRPGHRCRGRTPAPSDPNRRCHSAVGVTCAQARGASGDAPPRGPLSARRSSTALRWPSRACFSVAYRIPIASCSPPMIMVS